MPRGPGVACGGGLMDAAPQHLDRIERRERAWPRAPARGVAGHVRRPATCPPRSSARSVSRLTPKANQWWNVPLYVTARGLTTSPMPWGDRTFAIDSRLHRSRGRRRGQRRAAQGDAARLEVGRRVPPRTLRGARVSSASTCRSAGSRSECPSTTPFHEQTSSRARTTPRAPTVSGASCGASSRCSSASARASAASAARCTSSGAASTSPSRASAGAAPRRAARRGSSATPTTRSASRWASGRETCGTPWPGIPPVDASFYAYAIAGAGRLRERARGPRRGPLRARG